MLSSNPRTNLPSRPPPISKTECNPLPIITLHRFFKAKRNFTPEEVAIAKEEVTMKLGAFKFNSGTALVNPISENAPPPKAQFTFKFNFQNPQAFPPGQTAEVAKATPSSEKPPLSFQAPSRLNEERKFIVNKDLFTNPFINPFKGGPQAVAPKIVFQNSSTNVQVNPLNSSAALKSIQQKSLSDEGA